MNRREGRYPGLLFVASVLLCSFLVSPAAAVAGNAKSSTDAKSAWKEPAQYSVEWIMTFNGETKRLKRFVDGGKTRMEIEAEGQQLVLIERPDRGLTYMVMPEDPQFGKRYMEDKFREEEPGQPPPPSPKERLVGSEKVDGRPCMKYRIESEGQQAFLWTDAKTHAPVRLQGKVDGSDALIEWKNYRVGAQKADLFEPPAGYERFRMPDVSKMMGSMGVNMGMGMLGGMGMNMASQAGSKVGTTVGTAVGGPVGGIIGGWVGQHAAEWMFSKAQGAATDEMTGMGAR